MVPLFKLSSVFADFDIEVRFSSEIWSSLLMSCGRIWMPLSLGDYSDAVRIRRLSFGFSIRAANVISLV